MTEYNADAIKILNDEEIEKRFDWVHADTLAKKYNIPLEVTKKALEATRLSGAPMDYYEHRYCQKQPIPENKEFTACYLELMNS